MLPRAVKLTLLASAAAAAVAGAVHAAEAEAETDAAGATVVGEVVVSSARQKNAAATGLELTLRETPQSVSVMPLEQIRDFSLNRANDLLALMPGINVEQVETDRTYYSARGFDITNFQFDGVGLPLIQGIQFGDIDTVIFDRVEAVRGANSLMTGIGNPSATIKFVRKRPTQDLSGYVSAGVASWDNRRFEVDVSGPLSASRAVRGRLVYANQDGESYLDHYGVNRNVFYGVTSWDATPNLTLTAGYSRQDNRARGVLWGALPLVYSDGTRIDYPVSASAGADWTYWHVLDQTAFAEAAYRLGDWNLKATATYRSFDENAKLLYAFGNPDPVTGLGVGAMSGIYPSQYRQYLLDVAASGPVELFGRTHELAFGASAARSVGKEFENFSRDLIEYPPVGAWGFAQVAEPGYPGQQLEAESVDKLYRAYAAAHLNVTDRLKVTAGVAFAKLETTGESYDVDIGREESNVSPYAGVVFDLTREVSLYASYTDIFNPQSEVDLNNRKLAAAHGRSYEGGLKAELFEKRLYVSAAGFRSEQAGLAEFAGVFPESLKNYYTGLDTTVTGFELEAAGRITDQWTIFGGYTDLKVEGEDGEPVRLYIPRLTLKVATTYTFPELRNLKLGAAVRWQSQTSTEDIVTVYQDPYAELDLSAGVDVTSKVRATLNLKNVTDTKHLTSLKWNQAFYAAPRSVWFRLDYVF